MKPEFTKPIIVEKSWGRELWIRNTPDYCGKILEFDKNKNFSMHYHLKKDETWFVLNGSFIMEYFDLEKAIRKQKEIKEGDVVCLCPGVLHKLTAIEDSRIMEVSTQHFDTDSYRVEPSYLVKMSE